MNRERIPLVVGGCAYHLSVRTEHAASLVAFATHVAYDDMAASVYSGSVKPSYEIVQVDYQHTSNLPQGRCEWLQRARMFWRGTGEPRGLAVSIDADTVFNGADLLLDLEQVLPDDVAIGCAPVRVGGTQLCNLNITRVHESRPPTADRVSMTQLADVLAGDRNIESGGFGLAVFNLAWFDRHWPNPEPEGISMRVGEDIAMCRSVRARGGRVVALKVRTEHREFRP